jgi:hypothetical protein
MVDRKKIEISGLTKESTPCEICVAMNGREVEPRKDRKYFDLGACTTSPRDSGGSGCTDADRAQIKLNYLIKLKLDQYF